MNELVTRKSGRRFQSDRWALRTRRRGRANPPGHRRLTLEPLEHRRLLSAGELDPTFGYGGLVTTDIGYFKSNDWAGNHMMAIQTDGKIVSAGTAIVSGAPTRYDFGLVRYNPDGSLDDGSMNDSDPSDSFGTTGKVTTDFGNRWDYGQCVAIYPEVGGSHDGKIVVAGESIESYYTTREDFALARYNPDGSLDTTFGTGGKVLTDFAGFTDTAYDVAIDTAGRIVAVGRAGSSTGWDLALVRYNADGSPDTSFGVGGKVITDFGSIYDTAYGVAIDAAGQIVVVSEGGAALARYNGSDGSLDTSFGVGGAVPDTGENVGGRSLAIHSAGGPHAGKIVVANLGFVVARYNADGSLDDGTTSDSTPSDSFGVGGKATADFGVESEYAYGVTIDAADRIVAVGTVDQEIGSADDLDFAIARFNADGILDGSFGAGGRVTTDFYTIGYGNDDRARTVAIDTDGQIMVAGSSDQGSELVGGTSSDFALARYNSSDGSLDASFGAGGKVTTNVGKPSTNDKGRDLVAVQSDGKVLVVGESYQGPRGYTNATQWDFALARYNSDGSLDTSFGDGGRVATDFYYGSQDYATALAVYTDGPHAGKILVAGYSERRPGLGVTGKDFALARYNSDGTLDASFGGDSLWVGRVTTDFDSDYDYAQGLAIDAAGKIVVTGRSYQLGTGYDFALARYNDDGSLDTTFDGDGKVTTDFVTGSDSWNDYGQAVAIDPAGQIVAGGYSTRTGDDSDVVLARYNNDGSLDATTAR